MQAMKPQLGSTCPEMFYVMTQTTQTCVPCPWRPLNLQMTK